MSEGETVHELARLLRRFDSGLGRLDEKVDEIAVQIAVLSDQVARHERWKTFVLQGVVAAVLASGAVAIGLLS